jgi:Cu-Zn family superoxide dismutase
LGVIPAKAGIHFLFALRVLESGFRRNDDRAAKEEDMVSKSILVGAVVALVVASPALAADTAHAVLKDKDGKEVGTVDLTDTPNGVLMHLDLTAVPPGDHGFHVHAIGKCEPPDFKSAGGHFNPDETKHGLMTADGPHAGDMPNLYVPESGKITLEVLAPLVTLKGDPALLDADGSALVIHAAPDDYQSDPAGNAGDRIACGVVTE